MTEYVQSATVNILNLYGPNGIMQPAAILVPLKPQGDIYVNSLTVNIVGFGPGGAFETRASVSVTLDPSPVVSVLATFIDIPLSHIETRLSEFGGRVNIKAAN